MKGIILKKKVYSLKSLICSALQYQGRYRNSDGGDSDRYWSIVGELHVFGRPEIVVLAENLYQSHRWNKRLLAVDIFNQLLIKNINWSKQDPFIEEYIHYAVEESQAVLLKALEDDNEEIIAVAIIGLGHRPTPIALSHLINYFDHDNADIRHSVAFALGAYEEEASIDALLRLAMDGDDDVRDWATFALASLHESVDTPAIREVLWLNVADENENVSGEALKGLALRKDPRVLEVLKAKLISDCTYHVLEAAEYMDEALLEKIY